MKLRELMTTDVITIGPKAPLKEAARRMLEAHVSGLVVTDDEGSVLGVITEADFVKTEADRRATTRAGLLRWFLRESEITDAPRTVGDVMTKPVVTLGPDADHAEAARTMRVSGIKRVPVVDEENHLIGLVSRSDIMRALVRPDQEIIEEIRSRIMGEVLWVDENLVDLVCVDGNVILRGQMQTRSDAELLIELVRRVDGVISVQDGLSWEVDNKKVPYPPPTT